MDAETPGLARITALWLTAQSGDPQATDQVAARQSDPEPTLRAGATDAPRGAAVDCPPAVGSRPQCPHHRFLAPLRAPLPVMQAARPAVHEACAS